MHKLSSPKSIQYFSISLYDLRFEALGNALSTHIYPLIKLLRQILRIIIYSKYTPVKMFYSTTGIPPFNILVKYMIGLLMHTISTGNVVTCLQQLFKSKKEIHTHFTRHHFHSMKKKKNDLLNKSTPTRRIM